MKRGRRQLRGRRAVIPLIAALATGVLWSLASLLEDRPPWGSHSRVLGDLGNQSIPFLAYYRDVLTGQADGNLHFSWGLGYGQSFWPTFAMYLSNPLNLLVLAFPRVAVPTAATTITIATAMCGAAAMGLLLQRIRPGSPVLAAALAVAYGSSQYAANDASYHPMWLVGGVALPLMVYTVFWVRDGRWLAWLTPPVFFLCWYSDFYTSWMASLASGLIVCGLIFARPDEWPRPVATLSRWVGLAVLGIVMDAFSLAPTFVAVKHSAMTPNRPFRPGTVTQMAGQLLDGSDGLLRAPSIGIGVLLGSLLLTCILITRRERVTLTWAALLALIVLSLRWSVTSTIWHGFDTPDGNVYRQAFVVVALQVIVLWQLLPALQARGWRQVGAAALGVACLYGAVIALTRDSAVVTDTTAPVSMVLAGAAVLLVIALGRGQRLRQVATGVLVTLLAAEIVVNQVSIVQRRETELASQMVSLDGLPGKADAVSEIRFLQTGGSRIGVTVGTNGAGITLNDPMLFGGASGSSYTTMMPKTVSDLLVSAGLGASAGGRRIISQGNLLEDTAFGVAERVSWSEGVVSSEPHEGVTLGRWVPPADLKLSKQEVDGPLAFYASVLKLNAREPDVRAGPPGKSTAVLSVGCPVTAPLLVVDTSGFRVQIRTPGTQADSSGDESLGHLRVVPLRPARRATVSVSSAPSVLALALDSQLPPMICTSQHPEQAGAPAQVHRAASGFSADVPSSEAGETLLMATAATDEWSCRMGDSSSPVAVGSFNRMLTVTSARSGTLTCQFVPRASRTGIMVSLAGLVIWLLLALVLSRGRHGGWRRWRRPGAGPLV
jgi:uncharacterized membrane protein YfhO